MEIELIIESKESGAVETKRLPLVARLALGRGPESPVALEGNGLSREHLAFEPAGSGVKVLDLSSNGTWLNGKRLDNGKPHPVTATDRIEIPGYAIRCIPPAASSPAPAASSPASTTSASSSKPSPLAPVRAALGSLSSFEIWTGVLALAAFAVLYAFWHN